MTRFRRDDYWRALDQLLVFARETKDIWRGATRGAADPVLLIDALHWYVETELGDERRACMRHVISDLSNTLRGSERARGLVPPTLRELVFAIDDHRCQHPHCRTPAARLSVDHIVSRFHDGTNALWNLQTLCRRCNARKGSLDWHEFLALEAEHVAGPHAWH